MFLSIPFPLIFPIFSRILFLVFCLVLPGQYYYVVNNPEEYAKKMLFEIYIFSMYIFYVYFQLYFSPEFRRNTLALNTYIKPKKKSIFFWRKNRGSSLIGENPLFAQIIFIDVNYRGKIKFFMVQSHKEMLTMRTIKNYQHQL